MSAPNNKEKSARKIQKRGTMLKNALRSFRSAIWNVEQTDFHPEFVRMYEKAKEFGKLTKSIIDRTKTLVQPNPFWQKDNLPPADEVSVRLFGIVFNTTTAHGLKTKSPQVASFYVKTATSTTECGKLYTQFLMSVKMNTLKPLEKYVNEDLEQIRTEYYKLQWYKKISDETRNKLKTCTPDKIEKVANDLNDMKGEFEKQATLSLKRRTGITVLCQHCNVLYATYTLLNTPPSSSAIGGKPSDDRS